MINPTLLANKVSRDKIEVISSQNLQNYWIFFNGLVIFCISWARLLKLLVIYFFIAPHGWASTKPKHINCQKKRSYCWTCIKQIGSCDPQPLWSNINTISVHCSTWLRPLTVNYMIKCKLNWIFSWMAKNNIALNINCISTGSTTV